PDTQDMARSTPSMPLSSGRSMSNAEYAAEFVQQTQFPVQRRPWDAPISASRNDAHSGILSQENQYSMDAPFPRHAHPVKTPTRSAVRVPTTDSVADMDMPDDFFSDIDDADMYPLPRSSKRTPQEPSRTLGSRVRTHRAGDEFSDFSDDA